MKKLTLPLLAGLLLVPALSAQKKGEAPEYRALLAEFKKANQEFLSKRNAIVQSDEYKKLRAARDSQGIAALLNGVQAPNDAFVARFSGLAEKMQGKPAEADCLLWIVMNARAAKDAAASAAQGLIDRHVSSDQTWQLAINYFYMSRHLGSEGTRDALTKIIEGSQHKDAVAEALYARAEMVKRDRNASDEVKAAAESDIAKLREVAPDSTPALRLGGEDFVKEHLQIGMMAPDIEGEDIDGVVFKLSDYRGKVVVLDFWGDW